MSMSVGPSDGGDNDQVTCSINTTPLVDVMLVLLIIFLITLRVIVQEVKVELPRVTNQVTETKPENIVIAVDAEGGIYWNNQRVANTDALFDKLRAIAPMVPQPEIHIKGDREARYESVGRVLAQCARASIAKIGFITDPERGG